MIVYQADKKQFLRDNDDKEIDEVIHLRYQTQTGRRVPKAEIRSWRESLGYMAKVLRDEDIPADMGVAIEYHIPQSSKRIDVTLTGYGPGGEKNAVVVELKQWEHAKATAKDAIVVTYVGGANREVVHPSYQAWSYATLLEGFNEAVYDGGIAVLPCAYLHNYVEDGIISAPHYEAYIARAPLFLKGDDDRQRLRDFIKKHVRHGDNKAVLYAIENGRIRPSKALAEAMKGMLRGKPEFVLIDDQKAVYEAAMAAGQSATPDKPRVLIIEGGPGTGKTVVAVNLIVALTGKGLVGKYVSKNAAPRKVYAAKLSGAMTLTRYSNLFVGSGGFIETPNATFDFLVVDEAHRLNEKSGLYGNLGENQIQEIIGAAKCTVFFLDEDQRVTLKDIGSKEQIRKFAKEQGAAVEEYELASQFRCSGSNGYLAWLDNVLDIRITANDTLNTAEYDFQVFDDPVLMHAAIEAKNGDNKARVVAGYCWPWTSKKTPSATDINIGDNYKRRWNLDDDGSLWIISPESINEVGCIHTCQGLEVDYIGVIIGPDLIVRDGQVRTDPAGRSTQDQSIKGWKSAMKADREGTLAVVDLIIKNTYRTLMTRGMKGCYLYCTDEETRNYFKGVGAGVNPPLFAGEVSDLQLSLA